MKDIDLIPQSYKDSKRKKRSLRTQYIVLAGVTVIITTWNFINTHSLSQAKAQCQYKQQLSEKSQNIIQKFDEINAQIGRLREKTTVLKAINTNINIPAVISELAFLTDEKIVLSELKFTAEKTSAAKAGKLSTVRISGATTSNNGTIPLGNTKFKGVIRGIAADTADVSAFVKRLENSSYFQSVSLAFSRTANIKLASDDQAKQRQVSEFEISCYLANYRPVNQKPNDQ